MRVIGAHPIDEDRAYSVHRFSGMATLIGTLLFAAAILMTEGSILNTGAWQPLTSWTDGYAIIGGTLAAVGITGVAGLAFEDNDVHRWPRTLSLVSASGGVVWFGVAAWAFVVSWIDGYPNAGVFLAAPGVLLHANRLYLLGKRPLKAFVRA